jgi:Cu/Ag efflux protein CusF
MPAKLQAFLIYGILLPASAFADLVTLKTGAEISGVVESGTTRDIRIRTGGRLQVIAVERVRSIRFDAEAPAASSTAPGTTPPETPAEAPAAAAMRNPSIPAGTEIVVRTIDRIESKKADTKHEYMASLDQPVAIDGTMVAPVNSTAVLKVTGVKNAKVKGRSSLNLQVVALVVNGKRFPVQTEDVGSESGSQGKRTAIGAGAGAGVGAGIGGVAGGAGGAVAGAAAGAAAGTAAAVLFGQTVKIEPETRFTFKLAHEVSLQ